MVFSFIEHTFVINLPERRDRRREISVELSKIGLDSKSPLISVFNAVKPLHARPFPSIGSHGCFLSHLGVLELALKEGLNTIAVLEDDVNFSPTFRDVKSEIETGLSNEEWGMFYGGFEKLKTPSKTGAIFAVPAESKILCAHFICYRDKAIGAAHDYLSKMLERPAGDPNGGPMHVDGAFNWFRRDNPEFNVFAASTSLGHQRSSRSDIAPRKWFDRSPVTAKLASAARFAARRLPNI